MPDEGQFRIELRGNLAAMLTAAHPPSHAYKKGSALRRFYRRKHGGTPASIEIVVDNAVAGWPAFVFALNLFRDLVVARVLFHELGHHLDATIGAAAPTGEAAAEDWNRRLGRLYFRRYWWLRPFAAMFRPVVRWMRRRALKRKVA